MSIYNAIAQGSNIGAGINAFAQNQYAVNQDRELKAERQQQNAFAMQQNKADTMRQLFMDAAQMGPDAGFEYLARISPEYGVPPPDEKVRGILAQMYQSQQKPAGPPKFTKITEGDEYVTYQVDDAGNRIEVARAPRYRPAAPSVSVINEGDQSNPWQEQIFKDQTTEFAQIQEKGRNARPIVEQIRVAKNIDVRTNPGEGYRVAAQRIGSALGIPVDDRQIANADAFTAVMGRIVNDRISQEKGPQTEGDVKRFRETMASIENPPEARDFLLNYSEALALREIEQAEFFRAGVREVQSGNKDYDELRDDWAAYLNDVPLFRVMTNKQTGKSLPMSFYQFESEMKARNPGMTKLQIIKEWTGGN